MRKIFTSTRSNMIKSASPLNFQTLSNCPLFPGGHDMTQIKSTWGSRDGKYAESVEWLSFIQRYQNYLVLAKIDSKKGLRKAKNN